MGYRDELLNGLLLKLNSYVDEKDLRCVKNCIDSELRKYAISEISYELCEVFQNENAKILSLFKVSKKIEGISQNTLKKYEFDINKLFLFLNDKNYNNITTNDIRFFISEYQNSGEKKKSNTTMDNMRKSLSSFFSWCYKEGYIKENPMLRISKIKHDTIKENIYTVEEMENMMFQVQNDIRNHCILYMLYATGCRVSELCNINIEDIDLEEKTLHIIHGKGNKERIVPLDGRSIFLLKKYLIWRDSLNINTNALFVCKRNPHNRISKNGVEFVVSEISKKAGVHHAHPHRYRVTRITNLLQRGMNLEEVQVIAGHNDINTTANYNRSDMSSINAKFKRIA